MGTNYYRIPTEKELQNRKAKLIERVGSIDLSVANIVDEFSDIKNENFKHDFDKINCWQEFNQDIKIHIGKNSSGWKFLFNHNDWKYYKDMIELKEFINSGRLVNEYGEEQNIEEFWELVEMKQKNPKMITGEEYYEKKRGGEIDWGLNHARENGYYENIKWGYRFSSQVEFC